MSHTRCAKCGCRISKGDLKYRINVEMVADYGDLLSDLKEEVLEYIDRLLYQLGESEVLERELYEEIYFILCKESLNKIDAGTDESYVFQPKFLNFFTSNPHP